MEKYKKIYKGDVEITKIFVGNEKVWAVITGLTITGETEVVDGSTIQLGIAYTPSNTTQQGVTWSSSDETKATVDSSGLVTTIAPGDVVITATSTINGAISDTHNITIEPNILYAVIKPTLSRAMSGGAIYGFHEHNGWKYSVSDSTTTGIPENDFYWNDGSVAGTVNRLSLSEIESVMGANYTQGVANMSLSDYPTNKWYPDYFYERVMISKNPGADNPDTYGATGYKIQNMSAGTYKVNIWDVNYKNYTIGDGMFYKINGITVTPFTGNRFTDSSPDVHGTSSTKPELKEATVTIGEGQDITIIAHLDSPSARLAYGAAISAIEIEKIVPIPITGLSITGGTMVENGNTIQLGIAYTPSNTTQQGVTWSSSDETIATVDSNGLVTTIAPGDVVITATSIHRPDVTGTKEITIIIPTESITINGNTPIRFGNTEQFSVTYNPTDTTEVGVVWSSSDNNVATVDSNGLVTAIDLGTATIIATSIYHQDVVAIKEITIIPYLTITGETEVENGNTLQLGIEFAPSNIEQQEVTWSSSDETKAIVNSSGLVTALAGGDVVITATSTFNEALSDTHNVTINNLYAVIKPTLESSLPTGVTYGLHEHNGWKYSVSKGTSNGYSYNDFYWNDGSVAGAIELLGDSEIQSVMGANYSGVNFGLSYNTFGISQNLPVDKWYPNLFYNINILRSYNDVTPPPYGAVGYKIQNMSAGTYKVKIWDVNDVTVNCNNGQEHLRSFYDINDNLRLPFYGSRFTNSSPDVHGTSSTKPELKEATVTIGEGEDITIISCLDPYDTLPIPSYQGERGPSIAAIEIEEIKIYQPITGLTITGETEVDNGNTIQLGIEYTPSNTIQQGVTWSSSDNNVATVDSSGLVTAIGPGTATITATSIHRPDVAGTKEINITQVVITGLTITGGTTPIDVGNTEQLSVTYTPSNTTQQGVTWSSSDETIATVDSNGLVTAIGPGTATITATSIHRPDVVGTKEITITQPITGLTITGGTEVVTGNTLQLGIAYTPSNTTEVGVDWTSSDNNIATVDSNGLVTAIGPGTATITATSIHRPDVTGTKEITIAPVAITGLTITGETEVDNGNTIQLGIAYTPSNTTQQGVTWSSSDETKATVDSNGLVTAIAEGDVVITATSTINGDISDTHNITIGPSILYAVIKPVGDTLPTGVTYGLHEHNGWKYSVSRGYTNDVPENVFYWNDGSVAGRVIRATVTEIRSRLGSNYNGWSYTLGISNTLPEDKWYPDLFYTTNILRPYNDDEYRKTPPYGAVGYKISDMAAGTYKVKIWDVNTFSVPNSGSRYNINGITVTPFGGKRFPGSPNVHGTSSTKPQLKEATVTIREGHNIIIISHLDSPTVFSHYGAAISAIEIEKLS